MRVRKDQKGFTVVEVLIATAILSIVVLVVCGFIVVGSRSYAAGNSDISVQQEAQLALNQMSDVMIDTTRSVNYVGYDTSGNPAPALKDAEFAFTPEDKSLIMYNGELVKDPSGGPDIIEDGNGNKNYHFYWDKSEETLFYAEADAVTGVVPNYGDPGWVVLAGHVTDFSVDLSQVEEKRVVQLALTFLDGRKEYVTSNNVTIRNKVGVNDAELSPLNKKKTLSVVARDSGVIIEPGEQFHFSTPKVTGENVADRSVKWSLVSKSSADTQMIDEDNGILQVAKDERGDSNGQISLVITTNAVDSDGNHASCSVTVYIKRVTDIDLWKSADSDDGNGKLEISPGCTFVISANPTGPKVGQVCSVCSSPDIEIDKTVGNEKNGTAFPWRIVDASTLPGVTTLWNANEYIDIIESEPDHATFYVHADAPTSDDNVRYTAVIQCISLLSVTGNSYGREYDGFVPGAIEMVMVKGSNKKDISLAGSLHWGASTEFSCDPGNLGYNHYYIVCARIREYGTEGDDKIMMYLTEGLSSRVTPDMFGVEDVSKPWYLSLQLLNPTKDIPPGVGLSNQLPGDLGAQVNDPTVLDIINDYLSHCDSSGTYVGTKYPHTGKLETIINPPEIYYEYNGQTNLGGELKLKTVSTLGGPAWTVFRVDYVRNTRDEVLGYWFANNNVKFSMYRETAGGGLQKIYGYNADGNYYEGDSSPYGGALQLNEIQDASGVKIKLDSNRKERFSEAAGKYRLIPTIIYEQGSEADHVGGASVYYLNYQPNYKKKQCYEDKKSTVYYELVDGGNLELWSYAYNQFTKGEIYFPTPSDGSFTNYFDRENLNWQNAKKLDEFTKTIKGSSNTTVYQPSSMRCRYVADRKVYQLELFYNYYDSTWGRAVEVSAGVFQCAADGSKWERKDRGTFDSQLESGNMNPKVNSGATADVNFTGVYESYRGKMYIPLPSESAFSSWDNNGFGFTLKQGAEQTREWKNLKYQAAGQTNVEEKTFTKLTCTYNAAADEYTLRLYQMDWGAGENKLVATFTCKSDGKQWTQK